MFSKTFNDTIQSGNEDSSKFFGDGYWYLIHDFVSTFGVNNRPIYMALCSQLVLGGPLDTGWLIKLPNLVYWMIDIGSLSLIHPIQEAPLKSSKNLRCNSGKAYRVSLCNGSVKWMVLIIFWRLLLQPHKFSNFLYCSC